MFSYASRFRATLAEPFALICALIFGLTLASAIDAHDRDSTEQVYTLSNATTGNRVLSFNRDAYGRLHAGPSFATGGLGSGGGLGNQGAIVSDGEFLFAVNAGSDDVSVFRIGAHGLRLVDRTSSGGTRPVSVTVHGQLVYVLNAGSDNIAGFWMSRGGRLHALPGSERGLTATGTAPAQIEFTRDGRTLIVTEKATNKIVTFALNHRGLPESMNAITSAVPTPFGFALTRRGIAIISEAAGGAAGASALSSYRVRPDGAISVIDPAVGTLQAAACWVVISPDGRFAFTTNTGSGTISSYSLRRNGDLTLLESIAGNTGAGSAPIDMALSDDGEFLHVLNSGAGSITTFRAWRGTLTFVGTISGIPAAATGLVAF